jgi:hypothetical protein
LGIFDFFKKKEKTEETKKGNILLAMPMFENSETFEINTLADYLKSHWQISISDISGDNGTVVFTIQGESIALATMTVQIPWSDIEVTAKYSYNWISAIKDLENHNSHIIATVISSNNNNLERFKILTKVLSSIIATSNCLGVYQGSQSLLIPRQQYLESAEALKTDQIPIDLWVYIGLRKAENGNSAYTYGLNAFDKLEMEIINTKFNLEEIHSFLTNICDYIISSNVTLKSGETLGYTAEQKIKITKSKGQFVEGQSLKLEI